MSKVIMAHNAKKPTLSPPLNKTITTTTQMSMMPSKKAKTSSNGFLANDRLASGDGDADTNSIDFDDFNSSSSILEFLSREQECCNDEDTESIFQEVSRLADDSDTRSVDEILREAELLIQKQTYLNNIEGVAKKQFKPKINGSTDDFLTLTRTKNIIKMNSKYTRKIENVTAPEAASAVAAGPALKNNDAVAQVLSNASKSLDATGVTRSTSQSSLAAATTPQSVSQSGTGSIDCNHFSAFVENLPSESVISEESTPKDLQTYTATEKQFPHDDDDTDDGTDTMEEITEGIATIELLVNDGTCYKTSSSIPAASTIAAAATAGTVETTASLTTFNGNANSYNNGTATRAQHAKSAFSSARLPAASETSLLQQLASPMRRAPLNFNATQACSPIEVRRNSAPRRDSMQTPDSGISSHTQSTQTPRSDEADTVGSSSAHAKSSLSLSSCNKSTNFSPKHAVTTATSPIESISAITREHALKQDIELLQEKLKDTEERLQSLRIQHDSLSQMHRDLRESSAQQQEESEMLKLDVQHLNECANLLRSELQASRHDRSEALELQKVLQAELEESRQDKKRAHDLHEKDSKTIQDLQRQCREMERILMRKHPDSVSALIVASKNTGKMSNNDQENVNSRKLLEQRIAQLEADAKEQDKKAQQILANVQARFNSVQSKYETHIADLETQVLSLQEINTKLNEKIESQVRTLDYFVTRKAEQFYNNSTQTDPVYFADDVQQIAPPPVQQNSAKQPNCNNTAIATQTTKTSTRDHSTNTIALAPPSTATNSHPHSASSSTSSTANSTPNNSRPNSKQSGIRKPMPTAMGTLSSALASKLPVSRSDSTISLTSHAKEDAHLLATVRGMRVDLAIKDKAMQRLSRELDECKKTIRKLQKDAAKIDKPASIPRRGYDATNYAAHDQKPGGTESQALKEAQNKIKLLEADYKSLHDKRLQDLKTLQSSHERELSSCHETVRILQQRLNERDEAFAMQKRRKVPVDYYALKAKVSSLERRHSEREERLHMLVEALSKGRLNGALEDLLSDNNNA